MTKLEFSVSPLMFERMARITAPWYCKTCSRKWSQSGFRDEPCPYCGSDKIRPVTPSSPAPRG